MTTSKKKRMTKAEKRWHEMTDGKVLVAKVGKEKEFLEALNAMARIAHGALGWDGQAEMMYELGLYDTVGFKEKKKNKKQQVKQLKDYLVSIYLGSVYEVSEWVTPEEAENRRKASKVLYGQKPQI